MWSPTVSFRFSFYSAQSLLAWIALFGPSFLALESYHCHADETLRQKPSIADERSQLEAWVRDLQGAGFQQRERAFQSLWKAGPSANKVLEELANSPNTILATTANRLLLLRKLGASPVNANESLSDLSLVRTGDFHTLWRLARNSQWTEVMTLLELLDSTQLDQLLDDSSNRELLLSLALEEGKESIFPQLVDRLYPPMQARAARRLWKEFGFQFDDLQPKPIVDPTAAVFELEWEWNIDAAIEKATESGQKIVADFIRNRNFRWDELCSKVVKRPKTSEIRHVDQLQDVVLQTLYHRWSDREQEAKEWKELVVSLPKKSFEPYELSNALIAVGHTSDGIKCLEEISSLKAFQCYRFLGDDEAIFRLAGIKNIHDFDLDEWLKNKEVLLQLDTNGHPDFLVVTEVASLLYRLGSREKALKIEETLVKLAESNSTYKSDLLESWSLQNRRDRAIAYLSDFLDRSSPRPGSNEPAKEKRVDRKKDFVQKFANELENMLESVYPKFSGLSHSFLTDIERSQAKLSWLECLEQIEQLYHGILPNQWKGNSEFENFAWRIFEMNAMQESRQTHFALVLSNLAKDLGFRQLSEQLLIQAPFNPSTASLRMEAMAARGAIELALQRSEEHAEDPRSRRPGDLRLHLWRASWMEQLGQKDKAIRERTRALAIPMSGEVYSINHTRLKDAGFEKEANKLVEFAWNTAGPQDERLDYILQTLIEIVENDQPGRAAQLARVWQCLAITGSRRLGFNPTAQIYFQTKEYENESMKWVELGDAAEADAWFQKAFELRPDDINIPIRIVPKAREKFGDEIADKWFQAYFDHHLKHLEKWPLDAMFHNNLAWLAAKCKTRLSEALLHSRQACDIRPNDPTYMDTLAEIEFCLGNYDQAIELEIACRKIDAKDPHNKEQLARFQEAKQAAANKSNERNPLP